MNRTERQHEIWTALGSVMDPELDESVTDLEFVTDVEVRADGDVHIGWRLPTYWCSPNFAFLMASDMRDAVKELPWVASVSVRLRDHFSADLINHGVELNQDFRDAFPGESDDDLQSVRKTFLGKAFERRQELLIRHLLNAGEPIERLVELSLQELTWLNLTAEGERLRSLYVFAWRRTFPVRTDESLAFVTWHDGRPLPAGAMRDYLRRIGGVRRNAEFNSAICRSLLAERKADLRLAPAATR